ncbi:hypothetical protein ASPVEDRAFT_887752 [Aspergillus versicolor CBS 583.65]|uniref:Actin-like ATPase domain-containing protein n=1 Tax=Aspergillus versicolor CBS 583.65 TaxID=1036611 RepID=A0A1L9PKN7_ASPVE|nr:uncharacterized protein ASPVEDRAFT_887752 [Aspergillus versicolor CBS 583.65]OJJ02097.1 hypothetical protein ASPVEDRAFT_887752 [Aspergillus versicolor CBS 583.65]
MAHDRHKIIVGVDYGTTFTGKTIDDIVLIKSWPGRARHTETVLKTPSRIAYATDNTGKHRWGYQVEPGMMSYSWTKLLLDRGTPLTSYDAALEGAAAIGMFRLPEDKDAVQVASDFLSGVYEHILTTIAKQITEEALRVTPLEFWFTVPAIWSDEAKHSTLEAARRAGFGSMRANIQDTICLIPEPEAAAIAALRRSLIRRIQPDDGVLVCDCGGGTVDITTYLVKQVQPTLKFEELCTGIGGKCGSTAVDRKFYNLMGQIFGKAFSDLPRRRTAPGSDFMNKFEIIKRDFGYSSAETTHELFLNMNPVGVNAEYFNEDESLVIVSNNDLQSLFDPVVEKIISLVRQQIAVANKEARREAVNRIILVGGFGDSEYLRNAFRNTFGPTGNITVTVPKNAQAAIVQGAALRGLEGLRADNRRSRRHYGFAWSLPFRKGIDNNKDSYVHIYDGKRYARGYMRWMVSKGERIPDGYSSQVEVKRGHRQGDRLVFVDCLYSCDIEQAATRVEHQGVRKVGEIIVNFEKVDLSRFPHKVSNGKVVYLLNCCITVIFGAEEGFLKFEAHSDGQLIGATSINFTHTSFY